MTSSPKMSVKKSINIFSVFHFPKVFPKPSFKGRTSDEIPVYPDSMITLAQRWNIVKTVGRSLALKVQNRLNTPA